MFLIWGWRTTTQRLAAIVLMCPHFQRPAAHLVLKQVTKFTLFFIPLFPVHIKRTVECSLCAENRSVSKEDAERLVATAEQHGHLPGGPAVAPQQQPPIQAQVYQQQQLPAPPAQLPAGQQQGYAPQSQQAYAPQSAGGQYPQPQQSQGGQYPPQQYPQR